MNILELRNIKFFYEKSKPILKGITTKLESGKIYAILGPSGCGKTTLLSLIGGLDTPTHGEIKLNGENISVQGLDYHRRHRVSFIFQSYNLIDYLTPAENVSLTSKLPPCLCWKR